MKALVAYFSASHGKLTKQLAERIANAVGGDLYEIQPAVAYTEADLDWTDKKSRSTVEMNNQSFRPEIKGKCQNMDDYDTVFVGFPIWWYIAPTIINTFLESYDFSGKKVIPFVTSGGSGMGDTNKKLKNSCRGAALLAGKRFSADTDKETIQNWIAELNL